VAASNNVIILIVCLSCFEKTGLYPFYGIYSNSGRRTQCWDAASVSVNDTLTPGIADFTYFIIVYDERSDGYGQHRQSEKLTEHAGLQRGGLLAEMAVTMVLDALIALISQTICTAVNMNRRQKHHWHKHCQ